LVCQNWNSQQKERIVEMGGLKLFTAKIDTWAESLTIRAFNEHDAEGLTRALFKVPTDTKVTVAQGTKEVDVEVK